MSCGNGEIDPGEECDDATANNDELTEHRFAGPTVDDPIAVMVSSMRVRLAMMARMATASMGSDFCIRVGRCGDGIVQAAVETWMMETW